MAILGKMCITATFAIIYLYSCEIYPTVVRSVGVSSSSVFARVGGGVAPFVGSLDEVHAQPQSSVNYDTPGTLNGVTLNMVSLVVKLIPQINLWSVIK